MPIKRRIRLGSSGCYWNKTYARRPISIDCDSQYQRGVDFCREHKISRWVARAMLLKHIIAGSRIGGVWYYQILDRDCFDYYLMRYKAKRVPRTAGIEYQYGFKSLDSQQTQNL